MVKYNMPYNGKTDWQWNEIVNPEDMNRIEQGIHTATSIAEAAETPTGAQQKAYAAELAAKNYTDHQIILITETGIPKLHVYEYKFDNVPVGTNEIEIPLETFSKQTDTVKLFINTIPRDTDYFDVIDTVFDREGRLVEKAKLALTDPLSVASKITIEVWKHIPIGEEGSVSGRVIASNTIDDSRIGERSIDDSISPTSNKAGGSLGDIVNWYGNRIKTITGEDSWKVEPKKNIKQLNMDIENTNITLDEHLTDHMKHFMTINAINGDKPPSAYPEGYSAFSVGAGTTGYPQSFGFVLTFARTGHGRVTQTFDQHGATPKRYYRLKAGNEDIWTPWRQILSDEDFATDAETLAGTSTTKVLNPANAKALIKDYGDVIQINGSVTLTAAHKNKVLRMIGTAAQTITLPNDSTLFFDTGTQITVIQGNTGSVSFAPSSGVTLYSKDTNRTIDGAQAGVTLVKVTPNTWNLIGALK